MMNFRKSLCSIILLTLLLETSSSVKILATTETTTSELAITTELTTETTTTTEAATTLETILPSTEPSPSTSTPAVTEEPVFPDETVMDSDIPLLESSISIARGDNYPEELKKIPYASYTPDPWSYFHRQCTSFVAFRLTQVNGFHDVRNYGNAYEWGDKARRRGYTVNKTPALGSVAWFGPTPSGHVAWVSGINGNYVEIEEYNYWRGGPGLYNKRMVPISSVSGFIHFKDITHGISLSQSDQTLTVGSSITLTATIQPANASNKAVKWHSTNPKVATVVNGKVTAVATGQTDIVVTTVAGAQTARVRITVQAPQKSLNHQRGTVIPVFRLYNSGIKRHLYTQNIEEATILASRGWNPEGPKFNTSTSGTPVYRLYHANLKEHLYTTSKQENDILATRGWNAEGVAWYSSGKKPVYRLYHPGLMIHLYTADKNEVSVLVSRGWIDENVSFYAN